jgi:SAM-dependent methyltransferase
VVRLAEAGTISGSVLDAGCGTGETALYLAGRGHVVVGIDFAAAAIGRARAKAAARGLGTAATFVEWDALRLPELVARLGHAFDTILDVGLFHTLQPADRETYAASLRGALAPGGRCFVLCWSDRNPFGYGPERVRRGDLRKAFRVRWSVESIDGETLETLLPSGPVHAWLSRLRAV